MTSDATPRWALPNLFAGQAQKELFHNEALARIDMLLHGQVESADEGTPPLSPGEGQCWIIAAGATGSWLGREGLVACWTDGGWRYAEPRAGLVLWVADRGHVMQFDGHGWADGAVRSDGLYAGGLRVVGTRRPAIDNPVGGGSIDSEARSSIAAILSAMRDHGLIET
ncbi:DUF2793 domain-containing protein [Sphingomonadales bacterium 56]|uniref:DUF2793 domain-containing protein n=1 Tax=unclassified Sphingobium TaxID=2611147 RepID=UPI00191A33D3|nr:MULTISPECIES: DUF2793 domain-containing protein [unclassified Sphingobium]MBY2927115.1 DUF2793 domain-containing protein [Sphingomonadales bacterium 56]MBY2957183.1 DUF2793 domain-containing protein [Sphingomonadales bacterium 58]CAD7334539.1 hypothetical protein SPHS8_00053 [Sphingobium sp. S8]CAD7334558.1 hypothetical protein SPHS6_00053 [Sphingobium sp. S6]